MNQQARKLIVNADDFGMSVGINEGIVGAHRDGILTSTSLMVRRPAAVHALESARQFPKLSIGLHVELCEWACDNYEWRLLYEVVPLADPEAVRSEIRNQLAMFRSLTGRYPSHLDSHQHVHRSEPVRSAVLEEAQRLNIPVRGETDSIGYCGDFYGQTRTGHSYPEGISVDWLKAVLGRLPEGTTELACHPAARVDFESAYSSERVDEYQVLCDRAVRSAMSETGMQLTSFEGRGRDGLHLQGS